MVAAGADFETVGKAKQAAESIFDVIDLVCAYVILWTCVLIIYMW